jgi:acylphosphatase
MFAHIIVSGFVQGVGYRQFVKKTAQKTGLLGWVKNIDKGRVEIATTGSKEKIEDLIKQLKKGSYIAEVKNIEVEWARLDSARQARLDSASSARQGKQEPDFKTFEIISQDSS